MWTFRRPFATDGAEHLSRHYPLAGAHANGFQPQVQRVIAGTVPNDDGLPVTLEHAGYFDGATLNRSYIRAGRRSDADSVITQHNSVGSALGSKPEHEISIDRPVECTQIAR